MTTTARKTVWVCQACGKHAEQRDGLRDVACYGCALECWRSSLVFSGWRVKAAVAVSEDWVEP